MKNMSLENIIKSAISLVSIVSAVSAIYACSTVESRSPEETKRLMALYVEQMKLEDPRLAAVARLMEANADEQGAE